MKLSKLLVILAAVALFSPGCITHEETVYRDVARVKIQFENEAAARIFYEALSRTPAHRRNAESSTEVHIPVVFRHKERVITGENAGFNDAVLRCDTNKDGTITEMEARSTPLRGRNNGR